MSRKQKKNLIRILAAVAVLLLSVLLPVADWIKIVIALAAYGLPLCAFVAGAAAAYLCGGTQWQCVAAAFVMLGAGFALSRLISHKMLDKFSVCATKIL